MSKITRAQRRAARINGARSRGPVTVEGKEKSSRNAVRHGVLSSAVALSEEEKKLADGIRDGYVRRYAPQDQLEGEIVESLVMCQIKLRRLDRLELEAMERAFFSDDINEPDELDNQNKYPSLATLGRYRGRLNHERKLAEQRLMALIHDRPRADAPMAPGAPQHRFLAETIERAGRGIGTVPEPQMPANAEESARVTNEPSPAAATLANAA